MSALSHTIALASALLIALAGCQSPPSTPTAAHKKNPPTVAPVNEPPTLAPAPKGLQVAVTLDDLPFIGGLAPTDSLEAAVGRMIAAAEIAQAPLGLFFVCHRWDSVTDDPSRNDDLMRQWLNPAFALGNHSHSHKSLDALGLEAWKADISGCQARLQALFAPHPVPYFRYPMLQTGRTQEARDAGFAYLKSQHLQRAPVTIDTSDWALNVAYVKAIQAEDEDAERAIAAAYLDHIRASVRHYKQRNPDIPHILLLHANALAADHLGSVLKLLREEGFSFVSLDDALKNPIYAQPDLYTGPIGLSWLYRITSQAADPWRWDAAQTHAIEVRFSQKPERNAFHIDVDLHVKKLAPRAWLITHLEPWPANALLTELSDGTLFLVDTPYTPAATQSLLDWIKIRFGTRRLVVVNSHFHPDALGGNKTLIAAGAEVWGSDLTASLALERRDAMEALMLESLSDRPLLAAWFKDYRPVPPPNTFHLADGLVLRYADEEVRVIHPGPAHSPDGVVVFFPQRGLLFGGCMVAAGARIGNRSDADMALWPAAIRHLQSLNPAVVVPGHGDRTDPELLAHTLQLLENP